MDSQRHIYTDYERWRDNRVYTSYNRSANAYNYAARPLELPMEEERRVVRKKVVKRKKPVVYRKNKDKSLKIHGSFYIYGLVIFAGLMSLVFLNAAYVHKKNSVEALKKQISEIREANQDMRLALAVSYDENEIAALAAEMGMSKPKPYQIYYINVPKESYAMGGGITETPDDKDDSLIGRLLGYLYAD